MSLKCLSSREAFFILNPNISAYQQSKMAHWVVHLKTLIISILMRKS